MNKNKILIISIIAIILLAFILVTSWYFGSLKPVSKNNNDDTIRVEIPEGSNSKTIAQILENKNIIKSANATHFPKGIKPAIRKNIKNGMIIILSTVSLLGKFILLFLRLNHIPNSRLF